MKITKSSDTISELKRLEKLANKGCDVCPECGQKYSELFTPVRTWVGGLFLTRHWMVNCYKCTKCGCEWESEKYEWK